MRVSPLRCWALVAATAAAGALAQAVPPSTTLPNAVPLPAAKPGAIRPPGTAPNGTAVPGKLPDGTAVPDKLPDGTAVPGKLPPPPERPPGWWPRTTPQEGPELNAVPPPLAEGGEMRRERRELEPTPVLDAVGTVIEVKSTIHWLPTVADMVTGNKYKVPLGVYGKILEGADMSLKIGRGYYRDEGYGAAAAIDGLWESAKTAAVIEFSAGVATGLAGLGTTAAAPVAAAASAGYALGSFVDNWFGDRIFNSTLGKWQESDYKEYDRTVLEPQRQEMGRRLREKHQRMKSENAVRATVAAQAAEAAQLAARRAAASTEPPGPSAVELILKTVVEVQQAKAAAQRPPPGSSTPESGGGCGGNGPGTCR